MSDFEMSGESPFSFWPIGFVNRIHTFKIKMYDWSLKPTKHRLFLNRLTIIIRIFQESPAI